MYLTRPTPFSNSTGVLNRTPAKAVTGYQVETSQSFNSLKGDAFTPIAFSGAKKQYKHSYYGRTMSVFKQNRTLNGTYLRMLQEWVSSKQTHYRPVLVEEDGDTTNYFYVPDQSILVLHPINKEDLVKKDKE